MADNPIQTWGLNKRPPSSGAFLPASLMYFCSGKPMHFWSGVDSLTNDDDKPLKEAGVYNVGFAVHDDNITTRGHHISFVKTLGFGAKADIEAVKLPWFRLSLLKTPKAKEILEFLRHSEFWVGTGVPFYNRIARMQWRPEPMHGAQVAAATNVLSSVAFLTSLSHSVGTP